MPDYIARKRLKQKVLERWENEGGRIEAADIASAHRDNPTRDPESESNRSSHPRAKSKGMLNFNTWEGARILGLSQTKAARAYLHARQHLFAG